MSLLTNLISHWKLNEESGSRADSHGTNTLADNNTVLFGAGKLGNAADFEASVGEWLSITDNASLSLGADTALTVACWVNAESLPAGSLGIVAKDAASGANREYGLYYSGSASRFAFYVFDSTGTIQQTTADALGAPSTGTWYLLVGWHDPATDTVNIQANNGTVNSLAHAGGTRDGAADFQIGRFGTSLYWDGLIDSVSVWKRVLTADERTSLYNSGAGLDYESFSGATTTTTTAAPSASDLHFRRHILLSA